MQPLKPQQPREYSPNSQAGFSLILLALVVLVGFGTMVVFALNVTQARIEREKSTISVLAQAKEALVGDAVSQSPVTSAGYLRLPDLGSVGATLNEGSSSAPPNFNGNNKNYSVIGKAPWKTLGISPSRDGQGECPWYVVSGRFKNYPQTDALNWDTLGQIDVIDGNGSVIASNIAALLVAPGRPLDGQNRALSDPVYTQCGGNYDARNYLDSYNNSDAVSGEVNYFTGSTNNRVALNANNKRFVMTNNDHYNDRFLFVTVDDIFRTIIRRSDFRDQISALLDDSVFIAYLKTFPITGAGTKGTGNIDGTSIVNCDKTDTSKPENKKFCNNWLEMLLLTELSPPSPITIDNAPTPVCTRVLIFGGQKTATQARLPANKFEPTNYLEPPNLAAFAVPTATSSTFTGALTFSPDSSSADLLRCLP